MLISEDEKSRILNLHQNLGYKTSLNEQQQSVGAPIASKSNVAGIPPKIDQAILSKVQSTLPTPSKDPKTNRMSYLPTDSNIDRYNSVVKFLKLTRLGRILQVVDLPASLGTVNDLDPLNKDVIQNSDAINSLYMGIQAILSAGFAKSLEDSRIKSLGPNTGDPARSAAAEYLKKIGVEYNA
jgi:hypothetical protein